ncbi:hypothetical protein FACS1894141_6730 [Spirochaetia bacterium]|nr:hypothetical protein FACS1894141_6730 [Spirochaetia bacterium]
MLKSRNEFRVEKKENMRGGDGTVTLTHFVESGEQKNARLIAELTLPPGASIGSHQHDNETEYFIFLSGTGTVNDNGTEKPVKSGDVMVTGDGASHSVRNTGTVPLVFNALIITH